MKFSPPVNREVTSADVKYALERGFLKTVNGPYVGAYMSDIDGREGRTRTARRRRSPASRRRMIRRSSSSSAARARRSSRARSRCPASAPVPKEYAQKFDNAAGTSKYGNNQVFTGPYMIENDSSGKLTGYTPGSVIKLVRNPNWDASTDYKPAYVDSITIKEGNDADVASRQILEGDNMIVGRLPAARPDPRVASRRATRRIS